MKKSIKCRMLFAAVAFLPLFWQSDFAHSEPKDTLIVAYKSHIKTLGFSNPTTRKAFVLAHNWADSLVYRDPQKRVLVPCLAESYRPVGDHTIEFKLRKRVKFHNGEPFNAEAIKASFDYLTDIKLMPAVPYSYLEDVEIVDNDTVHIHTRVPYPIALDVIANILLVYPPKYLRKVGAEAFGKHPIGTGPYRFKEWPNPSEIVFAANPDYFGGPKGKAKITYLRVKIIPEELARLEALMNGEIDYIRCGCVSPDQIQILEMDPNIKVCAEDSMGIFFLIMDVKGKSGAPFFKDKRVRKALNYAIDKESLIQNVLKGYAKVTGSAATPFHFGYTADVETYPYDPRKAKMLLNEAGYPEGFEVDLYFIRDESVAEEIAKYLEAVGIKTNLKLKRRWRDLYHDIVTGKTSLIFLRTGAYSIFDASAILNLYFLLDSPRCLGSSPEVNSLLVTAGSETDPEIRRNLLAQAQQIISKEAFWVPLYYGNAVAAMNKDLNFKTSYDEIDRYFTAYWSP